MIWFFFRFSGRISRAAYFWGVMLMLVVAGYLVYRMFSGGQGSHLSATLTINLGLLALNWAQAAISAKRFHDFEKPGILALLLFVPMVNLVAMVVLGLIPGTSGPNKYGTTTNSPATA